MMCLRGTIRNLACGVGQNLDCDSGKTATNDLSIAITALGHLCSELSSQPTSPEALQAPHACRAGSRLGPKPVTRVNPVLVWRLG
jgi:hypothetical protein